MRLPKRLRNRIWATYVPGQEITKTPSEAYLKAADDVQEWIGLVKQDYELGYLNRELREGNIPDGQ